MPLVTGLLGQRSARLLATLLVVQSMKLATSSVTLSVDALTFEVGGVAVAETTKYPLLAIVNCSNGQLTASVDTLFGENLHVQLEKSSNNPDQFFVLPNSTGAVHPEGEHEITLSCRNETDEETVTIAVSILPEEHSTQPYFTDTLRYVNVSSNTLPGTLIANYTAKFGQQSTTQQYAVHKDFLGTPFQLNSSSGELSVRDSLQKEGTLSMYDIVIVADQGQEKAWTVTTIVIEADPTGSDPTETDLTGCDPTGSDPASKIQQALIQQALIQQRLIQQALIQQRLIQQALIQQRLIQQGLIQQALIQQRLIQQALIQQRMIQQALG